MMPARKLRRDWNPSQETATFRDVVLATLWGAFLVAVALLIPASCAHSAELHPIQPGEVCNGDDVHVNRSSGARIEGILIPDDGEYCVTNPNYGSPPAIPSKLVPPKKLTFDDGYREGWAEQHGPQFLFAWSEDDVATVRRALDKLEYEHERDPQVIDDYLLGREHRIKAKLDHSGSFMMYGMMWDLDLIALSYPHARRHHRGWPVETRWRLQEMSTPETTLTGFAVSRDRYCRPEQLDTDDEAVAERECNDRNRAAIALYGRIAKSRHMTPGGAER